MRMPGKDMFNLGLLQFDLYRADCFSYRESLVNCYAPRQILVYAYHNLVINKKIVAIEDMLQEEKHTAWETAKIVAQGRLRQKGLIELVQALLVIEYFLNVQKK